MTSVWQHRHWFALILTSLLFFCSSSYRPKRTLYSKKYGVDLIRYTHAANTVVYSSNKIDGMYTSMKCLCASYVIVWRVFEIDAIVLVMEWNTGMKWNKGKLSEPGSHCMKFSLVLLPFLQCVSPAVWHTTGPAPHPDSRPPVDCCWIRWAPCSLWSEVVVCTVWGSVILPHTGANCTSDCLAQGRVHSPRRPTIHSTFGRRLGFSCWMMKGPAHFFLM